MTERTLTPPEIDHLLSFFRQDRGASPAGAVESLDLKRPSRVPRNAVDTLRVRYDVRLWLDSRTSTQLRSPSPEHWMWLEYEAKF